MYSQKRIVPIEELAEILHHSKTQIYNLVNAGLITPYYFKGSFTKPFFSLEEVYSALEPTADGRVKRKSQVKNTSIHETV